MAQFGTIITNIGLAQIANAQVTQQKVGLQHIALGDGNGAHYVPTQTQTALINEVWRGPVASVTIDPINENRIIVEGSILSTVGGFTIREIGIFDDQNQLIAIGQYPEKYKPRLEEGIAEETIIHFVIETNNASAVKLLIDPTIIMASKKYVDNKVSSISQSVDSVVEAINQVNHDVTQAKQEIENHMTNPMPHEYTNSDNNKKYRFGFGVDAGGFYIIQQEVE